MPQASDNSKQTRRILPAVLSLALTVVALYALILPFRSDVEFSSADPAYFVLVAPRKVVRTFPVPTSISSKVRYEYDSQDGPAPARITMLFDAAETVERVVSWYSQRCEALGYQSTVNPLVCVTPGYEISVRTESLARGASVVVVFEEAA